MSNTIRLSDGKVGTAHVERQGDIVRRATGPGAAAVHRLLGHLTDAGLPVPRPISLGEGIEELSFIEGVTPTLPWPAWIASDELMVDAVRLLRRLHDATAPLVERLDGPWWTWVDDEPVTAEVICHGDPWPPNLVVDPDDRTCAVAWIDWDLAQPGRRIDDVAAFAKHWVPLMSDERARAHGWPSVPDRLRRLTSLCDAYGLDDTARTELPDAIARFARVTAASHRSWAAQGHPTFQVMVARGIPDAIEADGGWARTALPSPPCG
jgi:Phosphotransferase enzyme family